MAIGRVVRIVAGVALAISATGCAAAPLPSVPATSLKAGQATVVQEPSASATAPPSASPDVAGFPTQVLGLPVMSIGDANRLIASGELYGHVAAVRGYWESSIVPSCPAPDRWYSPLEGYCNFDVFSDVPYQSADCHSNSDGSGGCNGMGPPPGAKSLKPLSLDNYENELRFHSDQGDHYFDPWPIVLVGHAGDARYLQCLTDSQAACRLAFVVDTVAWANGQMLDLAIQAGPYSPKPRMSFDDLAVATGAITLVFAVPVRASDVSGIEPRMHSVGDDLTWVVHSLGHDSGQTTRSAEVWEIADRDGAVVSTSALEVAPEYRPSYLKVQGVVRGYDPGSNNGPYPFFGVARAGESIHESLMGSGGGFVGGGPPMKGQPWYPGAPLLLDPGEYLVRAWRSTIERPGEKVGPPMDVCTATLTLAADQHKTLEAAFPAHGACVWRDPTFDETPFDGS